MELFKYKNKWQYVYMLILNCLDGTAPVARIVRSNWSEKER